MAKAWPLISRNTCGPLWDRRIAVTDNNEFTGRTMVVTGGAGVLGGEIACSLVARGASVAILDKDPSLAERFQDRLKRGPGRAVVVGGDVLDSAALNESAKKITDELGHVDTLINAAGGNHPGATTGEQQTFFDLPAEALRFVGELNLLGTILPCQVFGQSMAERRNGVILNISSMNAFRPLTRIPAYSAAKAAVSNFTQWLAVHMATGYSPEIRVNALAPGFFLTEQNRFLLTDKKTGDLTERGRTILEHTPMARFGEPGDLIGPTHWLVSAASSFVTGVVVPIDGGFSAFSGV
jgi:NAD(P)-dependent dehydrogenase (short-subunit alcohol dehydrogenase family)